MTYNLDVFYHIISGAPRAEYELNKWSEKDFNEILTALVLFYQNN